MSWFRKTKNRETASSSGKLALFTDLKKNIAKIKQEVGNSPDIIVRELEIGDKKKIPVAVVYTEGLVDKDKVNDFVTQSLRMEMDETPTEFSNATLHIFQYIKSNALTIGKVKVIKDWNSLILSILSGETIILIDGFREAISGDTKGGETRAVSESTTEVVIRGPKDSFTESLGTNVSLIRRRIKSPNLWLETMKIGEVTQTDVSILYIKSIANDKLVQEVKDRLNRIEIDGILESGYIEDFIQDERMTPYPTVFVTERPDLVALNLLEGRIAILVDGSPYVLIVPTVFSDFFRVAEDYYYRTVFSTFIRILRYGSYLISLLVPSMYIAATTFHQEMIPTTLLISLAASREGIPFPALVEGILMELTFEIMREAGVRLPRAVGQAVSIVGALVLGQAAVQAGFVSPVKVIVVAITGIASFTAASFFLGIAARMIRFPLMIIAASFGFYGIMLGLIVLVAHLTSLRSFGVPYLAPFAPFILSDQKDGLIRLPIWKLRKRPRLISQENQTRMDDHLQPSPQQKGSNPVGGSNES